MWETHNKAECEEGVTLDDTGCPISTMVALADNALVTLDFLSERVFSTNEEEEHRADLEVSESVDCSLVWFPSTDGRDGEDDIVKQKAVILRRWIEGQYQASSGGYAS